jgi:hypothetical protein
VKKGLLCVVALFSLARVNAETQISFGVDYGIGTFSVDNDFDTVYLGLVPVLFNETSSSVLFTPGFGFTMRKFPENTENRAVLSGFFFHCNILFPTKIKQEGTLSVSDADPTPISETLSGDDFLYAVAANFNMGASRQFEISQKLRFYVDSGLNISIFNYDSKEGVSRKYIGVGIFGNLALQFNVTGKLYIEAGLNGTINLISYQEGYYTIGQSDVIDFGKIEYEDAGTFDLIWLLPSIHIGWHI